MIEVLVGLVVVAVFLAGIITGFFVFGERPKTLVLWFNGRPVRVWFDAHPWRHEHYNIIVQDREPGERQSIKCYTRND